jgi:hypothetical protein
LIIANSMAVPTMRAKGAMVHHFEGITNLGNWMKNAMTLRVKVFMFLGWHRTSNESTLPVKNRT